MRKKRNIQPKKIRFFVKFIRYKTLLLFIILFSLPLIMALQDQSPDAESRVAEIEVVLLTPTPTIY